jgi:hypothetical protein
MMSSLAAYREHEEDVPAGYLKRSLSLVPGTRRGSLAVPHWREVPARVAAAARKRPAVASLTGAAIGAAAIGLVAWRRGRRALREAAGIPELAPQ